MQVRETMGVLGPVGTHSEAAARYLMEWQGLDREIVCYGDIGACLRAVETDAVHAAFVPVENSLEGAIAVTLDVLARSDAPATLSAGGAHQDGEHGARSGDGWCSTCGRGCRSDLYAACGCSAWSGGDRGQDRGQRGELHALL